MRDHPYDVMHAISDALRCAASVQRRLHALAVAAARHSRVRFKCEPHGTFSRDMTAGSY